MRPTIFFLIFTLSLLTGCQSPKKRDSPQSDTTKNQVDNTESLYGVRTFYFDFIRDFKPDPKEVPQSFENIRKATLMGCVPVRLKGSKTQSCFISKKAESIDGMAIAIYDKALNGATFQWSSGILIQDHYQNGKAVKLVIPRKIHLPLIEEKDLIAIKHTTSWGTGIGSEDLTLYGWPHAQLKPVFNLIIKSWYEDPATYRCNYSAQLTVIVKPHDLGEKYDNFICTVFFGVGQTCEISFV